MAVLFCGKAKPNPLGNFFSDYLLEFQQRKEHGVIHIDKNCNAFICDVPARAYLKCVKGHNAYYILCKRCPIRGSQNGRVAFHINGIIPLCMDEDFTNFRYENHQVQKCPFINASISCVKSFALDYMHL